MADLTALWNLDHRINSKFSGLAFPKALHNLLTASSKLETSTTGVFTPVWNWAAVLSTMPAKLFGSTWPAAAATAAEANKSEYLLFPLAGRKQTWARALAFFTIFQSALPSFLFAKLTSVSESNFLAMFFPLFSAPFFFHYNFNLICLLPHPHSRVPLLFG